MSPAASASETTAGRPGPSFWKAAFAFVDFYFPLTFPGCVLFVVSFFLLGRSFADRNGFALWFSLLGLSALLALVVWGRVQAFRLRHVQVSWDANRALVARMPKIRQVFTAGGGRAPFFFRLHYLLRGSMPVGRAAKLCVRVEAVGADAAQGNTSATELEAPLWFPACGNVHLGGRLALRDVFGLTRHRIGDEEFRDLLVLPPLFPEKTPIKFQTMFSEEASRRHQISEEEKYYMREYIPGDRLKDINWKASQRVSELITRISPHALEESKLLHVEFRNFREGTRDSAAAILHLNFLKSWVLSFMQAIKRDHPEFLFQVVTSAGSHLLESGDDIQGYARVLSALPYVSMREGGEIKPDPNQEKFIFTTMYDAGLQARINSFPGVRYNIFRTVRGGGERSRLVRFFRSEVGAPLPGAWVLRPDGASVRAEVFPAPGGGVFVEQRLRVRLF